MSDVQTSVAAIAAATIDTLTIDPVQAHRIINDLKQRYQAHVPVMKAALREGHIIDATAWQSVKNWGGPQSEFVLVECEARGISGAFKDDWALAVQLVDGKPAISAINMKKAKKDRRNEVALKSKLLAGLDWAADEGELGGLTADQIADWIIDNGGTTGVIAAHKSASAGPSEDNDDATAVIDMEPFRQAMFGNAFVVDAPEALTATMPAISLHDRQDDKLRVLPLPGVPTSLLEALLRYLPAKDANIVDDLRWWGTIATLADAFEFGDSEEVMRPDDEMHAGSAMLPTGAIVRILDERRFRVAASRVTTGIIVQAVAREGLELGLEAFVHEARHINVTGTKLLSAQLGTAGGRSAYDLELADRRDNARAVRITTDERGVSWASFKSRDERYPDFKVKLLPMSKFGSSAKTQQWTLDIRDGYAPVATSAIETAEGKVPAGLRTFAAKASGSKHSVKLAVTKGALSVALAKSNPIAVASAGEGSATVDLRSDDFAKVFSMLERISAPSLKVSIDTKGVAEFQCQLGVGKVSIFVPTILKDGIRNQALLTQVRRP